VFNFVYNNNNKKTCFSDEELWQKLSSHFGVHMGYGVLRGFVVLFDISVNAVNIVTHPQSISGIAHIYRNISYCLATFCNKETSQDEITECRVQ
jgi:hypothetical protein